MVPAYSPSHPRGNMFRAISLIWEIPAKPEPYPRVSPKAGLKPAESPPVVLRQAQGDRRLADQNRHAEPHFEMASLDGLQELHS